MDPKPPLRPATSKVRSYWGNPHLPIGEVTLQITIPSLKMVVDYDFVVDTDVVDPLLIDNSFQRYTRIHSDLAEKKVSRGNITTKVFRRITKAGQGTNTCRRIALAQDWVIQERSRTLIPGKVQNAETLFANGETWLVEPMSRLTENHQILICKSLCTDAQVHKTVPVEVYNPGDEPIRLRRSTCIGKIFPSVVITESEPIPVVEGTDTVQIRRVSKESMSDVPEEKELEEMINETTKVIQPEETKEFKELVYSYRDIFCCKDEPLGMTNVVQHSIDTGDEKPIKNRMRRTPPGLRQEVLEEEAKMKKLGVIEMSESPWASPVVLVRKKDNTIRYCIDYRRVNGITKKDSYPLPNIQECLDSLSGAKYFTSMDLSSGYWQVGLDEDAKDKTSFYGATGGLWRFTVMPFGLCNAPATFERLMEKVLHELQWQICLCYLDDILVFSKTAEEHMDRLKTIFDRLRNAKLKLKPKKCHFFQRKISFLGHVVSGEGIATDPGKIAKVMKCPSPKNVHEVRSVVGFMSYYRKFIPKFSEIAKPLIKLTEKNVPFKWEEQQESAFQTLKEALSRAPVLAYPTETDEFILDTDASDVGMGGVLSQIQDGKEVVISYGSKAFSKTERNYCITRRELKSVVQFTDQFRHFLLGRKFRVRTDNNAVKFMRNMKQQPTGQVSRWLEQLQVFDFDTEHRPGTQHGNADGLSRKPFIKCAHCGIKHTGGKKEKRETGKEPTKEVPDTPKVEKKEMSVPDSEKLIQKECKRRCAESKTKTERKPNTTRKGASNSTTAPMKRTLEVSNAEREKDGKKTKTKKEVKSSKMAHRVQQNDSVEKKEKKGKNDCQGKNVFATRILRPRGQAPSITSWMSGGITLDRDLLRDEQWKDPAVVDALVWLRHGIKPERQNILSLSADHKFLWANLDVLQEQDGLLVRTIQPKIGGTVHSRVVMPRTMRREAISRCHDTATGGHFYFWKTYNTVKKYFIWPGMRKDVQNYCRACHVCATKKNDGRQKRARMHRYDVGMPMEEISLDLKGPFPASTKGNKWVLVVVDSFTKWMEAYSLPDSEAETVAAALVDGFIARFGVPYWIKTDRGSQLTGKVFTELCKILEVDHRTSTPFHPQGNAKCERMVKVVGNLISCHCRTQKEWDDKIPLLTMAYRSTLHEVTGYTPNYLMLGREIFLPLDIMIGTLPEEQRKIAPTYVKELKENLESCFEEVRDALSSYGERQRRYYNLRTRGEELKVGSVVYMMEKTRKKGVAPKLAPRWKGPYLIIQKCGTVYELQTSHKTSKMVHFDLLKLCHKEELPRWLTRVRKKLGSSTD